MKTLFTVTVLGLLSIISAGANAAAHQINSVQAQGMQSIGAISVSQISSAPMDMGQELSQAATQQGASAYRIIEARIGNNWHTTAELYK